MNAMRSAYMLGRAACWHGTKGCMKDSRFKRILPTTGIVGRLLLIFSWRRGWRDAARGDQ